MANAVNISGMFGSDKTYFADSPVIIEISNLAWPSASPFNIVNMEVVYGSKTVGMFRAETGGQSSISFDISSALRAIWAEEEFSDEVSYANRVAGGTVTGAKTRDSRSYSFKISTEYIKTEGTETVYEKTECSYLGQTTIPAGKCVVGGMTEWERSLIAASGDKTVARCLKTNVRFGGASTKPTESPEHVGIDSITSWVGVSNANTTCIYYTAGAGTEDDDPKDAAAGSQRPDRKIVYTGHVPIVLRDSQEYVDFLFVNRRGAVETCSGLTKEAMEIGVEWKHYGRVEGPTFRPSRSVMALGSDGRRSWSMSSGYVTREWAEWWATEFLGGKRKRWWMRWKGPGMASAAFVPVIVEPAKKSVTIYDRTKQNMPHVDFTVTLALEG